MLQGEPHCTGHRPPSQVTGHPHWYRPLQVAGHYRSRATLTGHRPPSQVRGHPHRSQASITGHRPIKVTGHHHRSQASITGHRPLKVTGHHHRSQATITGQRPLQVSSHCFTASTDPCTAISLDCSVLFCSVLGILSKCWSLIGSGGKIHLKTIVVWDGMTLKCTMYIVHCTLYSLQWTMYNVQCSV